MRFTTFAYAPSQRSAWQRRTKFWRERTNLRSRSERLRGVIRRLDPEAFGIFWTRAPVVVAPPTDAQVMASALLQCLLEGGTGENDNTTQSRCRHAGASCYRFAPCGDCLRGLGRQSSICPSRRQRRSAVGAHRSRARPHSYPRRADHQPGRAGPMKKLLLAGVAALSLSTGAHAADESDCTQGTKCYADGWARYCDSKGGISSKDGCDASDSIDTDWRPPPQARVTVTPQLYGPPPIGWVCERARKWAQCSHHPQWLSGYGVGQRHASLPHG